MVKETKKQISNPPVIICHGDKGGVGKSVQCSVICDWLQAKGISFALIDGDTRNPDVARMFKSAAPVAQLNLRTHDGWMDLTDFMSEHLDRVVVISMPAGIGEELEKEGANFIGTVRLLERPMYLFWIINRLPDSVNLLAEAERALGGNLAGRFVVKNLFFGPADKFTRWDNSDARRSFEAAGGITLKLPELHERTVDKLYADNDAIMPFSLALQPVGQHRDSLHGFTASENMELIHWVKANHESLDSIRHRLGL